MKRSLDDTQGDVTLGGLGTGPLVPHTRLEPKLLTILRRGYTRKQLARDVVAGLIVGIVALPLAIAFAIASGVKPEQGIYTAILAGFVAAALGGSRTQVSGPTGAFIVIIYGIVQQYGYDGLAVATLIAGFLLIGMGLLRAGAFLRFVPYPVTVGFTSGIALIIFSSQMRDLCGLEMETVPADFVAKWSAYAGHVGSIRLEAVAVAALSLAVMLAWPAITRKVPGSLVAIVVATAVVHAFQLPVETIASRFGSVPSGLPAPHLPALSWDLVRQMFSPAVTIALLAALESLLSAVVADGMLGTRHRSNMELVAQGVGNVVSPLCLGIPATGAIARTATNVKNGGRTPVAAIVHSLTLLAVLLFAGRWAALIPMPTLAAILVVVAYNMSEWRAFVRLFRAPKSDVAVLVVTFLLTVFIDLTVAIQVGVVLAAFLFLQRMASVTEVSEITDVLVDGEDGRFEAPGSLERRTVPPGVEVFEIYGSLFFGAVEHFNDALRRVERRPRVLVLRMREVHAIDASGLQSLDELRKQASRKRTTLVLSGVRAQPREAMERSGLADRLGRDNIVADIDEALARAGRIVDEASAHARGPLET
jgi:SulP family sulfate permease